MRLLPALIGICLLALLSAPHGAVAAPTCAEGPVTVGDTTYGTPCADVITAPAGVEAVKGGGGDDTIIAAPVASAISSCPYGCRLGVGSQTFEGGEGDDIVAGDRGNDILRGGPGNDQLFGGIGDDLLQGGPGNDRLGGGFGADSIDGEEGDDYARGDATIDRIFDSGGGIDTLSYSTGVTPGFGGAVPFANFPAPGGERGVRLELGVSGQNANNGVAPVGGGVDEVETGVFEVIIGTPFADYIVGTGSDEVIYGGGGADALVGGGGNDTLVGGADGDVCQGTATVECEGAIEPRDPTKVSVGLMAPPGTTPNSQVYFVGGSGREVVSAYFGGTAVAFSLSAGSFDLSGVSGSGCEIQSATVAYCPLAAPLDSVLEAGMGGDDEIGFGSGPGLVSAFLIGGEGNDVLTGGEAVEEVLVDGPGDGRDILRGSGGDEALTHNGGADELLGGDGNDLFLSNSVCDGERIVGGAGRDNASWARFDEAVAANLETGVAGHPGSGGTPACPEGPFDSISEVEDLEGSSFGDVFYGDAGPNQLLGHPGPDVYVAGAGEDSILANSGDADLTIDCGADADEATIDRPEYGDPAPVECERVFEADPNNFRTRTLLPPPPLPPAPKPPRRPVDRRPPTTRLTYHPRALLFTENTRRRVVFRFASSEPGSSFRCKLDAKPYRPCALPGAYLVKAGRHAFRVFAVDAAGNRDRTPALFRFRVRAR